MVGDLTVPLSGQAIRGLDALEGDGKSPNKPHAEPSWNINRRPYEFTGDSRQALLDATQQSHIN